MAMKEEEKEKDPKLDGKEGGRGKERERGHMHALTSPHSHQQRK